LNRSTVLRRLAVLAPAVLLAVGGCEENRATTFAPVGALGFNFGLQTVAAVGPYGFANPQPQLGVIPATLITAGTGRMPAGQVTYLDIGAQTGKTVVVDLSWLRALTSPAVYQVWGRSTTYSGTGVPTDVYKPLYGSLMEYRLRVKCVSGATVCAGASTDTTFDVASGLPSLVVDSAPLAAAGRGTYAGSDNVRELVIGARFILSATDPANTVNPAAQEDIVVSIEPAGAATTPSASIFLWRRIGVNNGTLLQRDQNGTVGAPSAMTFGNYGGRDQFNLVSPNDYRFVPAGAGAATIRGSEIAINFTDLSRPPRGFYYRVVTQDSVTSAQGGSNEAMVDTLRSSFSGVASVSRVSLFDADVNDFLPGVASASPTAITAPLNLQIKTGSVRNCVVGNADAQLDCANTLVLPAVKPFSTILHVALVLEPKLSNGATLGRGAVLSGDVPDPAKK
jgi:hypothetical protein